MIHRTTGTGKAASAALNVRKGGAPVALATLLAAAMFAGNVAHAAPLNDYLADKLGGEEEAQEILAAVEKNHASHSNEDRVTAALAVSEKNHEDIGLPAQAITHEEGLLARVAKAEKQAGKVQEQVGSVQEQVGSVREQVGSVQAHVDTVMKNAAIEHVTGAESENGGLAIGNTSLASAEGSTAHGVGAKATAKNAVALGAGSVAGRENTVSVGSEDVKRTVSNVADGVEAHDAVNVQQLNTNIARAKQDSVKESFAAAKNYTDQQVGEIRGDINQIRGEIRQMDRSFRKGIASVAALQMTTPYAPGRIAVNAGTALYRGQAAVAIGASYWNTAGDFNVNAGVATAGSNSTVVRAGIGYLF